MRRATRQTTPAALVLATLAIAFGGGLLTDNAAACQYTVRHVAFVDLGDSPYRLYFFTKGDAAASFGEAVNKVQDRLAESNVEAELVNLDANAEHSAAPFLQTAGATEFPAAVLLSPDGRALLLAEGAEKLTAANVPNLIDDVTRSKIRDEIFSRVLDVHSVMIVIEGEDAELNERITQMTRDFIPKVRDHMPLMPKPAKEPPHMIVLTREQAKAERVLLWSVGADLQDTSIAQVALLFGRGRRLGPVLRFPGDDVDKFEYSLAVVGQDCECGLDRSWMQGDMIPHIWNEESEKVALAKLGFDPGSPEVKTEIAQLLSRGPSGKAPVDETGLVFPSLGYQEIELVDSSEGDSVTAKPVTKKEPAPVEVVIGLNDTTRTEAGPAVTTTEVTDESETTETIAVAPSAAKGEGGSEAASPESEPEASEAEPRPINVVFLVVGGLIVVVLAAGGVILARSGQENR